MLKLCEMKLDSNPIYANLIFILEVLKLGKEVQIPKL